MPRSQFLHASVCLILLPLAGCLGPRYAERDPGTIVWRQRRPGLTNPLLDLDNSLRFRELKPFENELASLVERLREEGRASEISVYFRDMNNGYWTGLDENARFMPASLLKVPLAMAYLKWAESEPSVLKLPIRNPEEALPSLPSVSFPSGRMLEGGRHYSVEELLRAMLADSDNTASRLLAANIPQERFLAALTDLNIPAPADPEDFSYALSVKQYATFFRILYNASYLSREMSEAALQMLIQSSFREGIVAGLEPGAIVAHKFAERSFSGEPFSLQLHDCGIVYHPEAPYLLCVMTRGSDFKSLTEVIREVSNLAAASVKRSHERK